MRALLQLPMDPLAELRDIHLPPAPAWWPPAPGWWLVGLAGVAALALLARYLLVAWRRGRARRAAARALSELRRRHARGDCVDTLTAELATLLRRAAMSRHPREQVAGLTGRAWLEFLDDEARQFSNGVGRCLVTAPYRRGESVDFPALLKLCESWLRRNA
jgi:hypothetical protein